MVESKLNLITLPKEVVKNVVFNENNPHYRAERVACAVKEKGNCPDLDLIRKNLPPRCGICKFSTDDHIILLKELNNVKTGEYKVISYTGSKTTNYINTLSTQELQTGGYTYIHLRHEEGNILISKLNHNTKK